MDEASITQQYYIATRSSPSDERARVLKYGKMFAVFDRHGDIEPLGMGEQGVFFQGTRFLSELGFQSWGAPPLLLSSTVKADNFTFTADLTNLDVYDAAEHAIAVPRGTIHVLRSKFLWKANCYEEFRIVNFGLEPVNIPIRIAIGADFADIFEVRGTRREGRGRRLDDKIEASAVTMAYEGLDHVIRRTRVESDLTPTQISAEEMQFEIALRSKRATEFHLTMSCNPERTAQVGYSRAVAAADGELKAAVTESCRISASHDRFNRWIRRSAADVEMMTIGNPETDFPYAGVPWFSTIFGRDGIITAMEMLWVNPAIAKGVLQYLASTQATEVDKEAEAEPGKILHEMRRGEMASLGEVPFGRYYGSVDATPLFIMLAGMYYDYTGDRSLLEEIWPHVDLALHWIDQYGDTDKDGFVEYSRHGKMGLVQQGWKDSNDSVFHADGTIAEPPIALCEVQAYVYAAKLAAAKLSGIRGDEDRRAALESEAAELQESFEKSFWCEELSTYALALDGDKRPCRVRASNAGHCLFGGIASRAKARVVAHTLMSKDFLSGWGVRTLGTEEARYNPLSYHNGSVWPHDNAIVASGLARYGFRELAGRILLGLLDVSSAVELHRLPELFCGLERRRGEGPTLYPVACSPQAWSAAAVFMLLQACIGISIDGPGKRIMLEKPLLPEGLNHLWIRGLKTRDCSLDLHIESKTSNVKVEVPRKQGECDVVVR